MARKRSREYRIKQSKIRLHRKHRTKLLKRYGSFYNRYVQNYNQVRFYRYWKKYKYLSWDRRRPTFKNLYYRRRYISIPYQIPSRKMIGSQVVGFPPGTWNTWPQLSPLTRPGSYGPSIAPIGNLPLTVPNEMRAYIPSGGGVSRGHGAGDSLRYIYGRGTVRPIKEDENTAIFREGAWDYVFSKKLMRYTMSYPNWKMAIYQDMPGFNEMKWWAIKNQQAYNWGSRFGRWIGDFINSLPKPSQPRLPSKINQPQPCYHWKYDEIQNAWEKVPCSETVRKKTFSQNTNFMGKYRTYKPRYRYTRAYTYRSKFRQPYRNRSYRWH